MASFMLAEPQSEHKQYCTTPDVHWLDDHHW